MAKATSHCSDNEDDNATQRECILLVKMLHAEYAHATPTLIQPIVLVIGACVDRAFIHKIFYNCSQNYEKFHHGSTIKHYCAGAWLRSVKT